MASSSRGDSPSQSNEPEAAADGAPPAASASDAELLARHVDGDHDAFGELVHRHRERLWAVALRTLGDREEAADALQDALVSAFRSAHTFQGRSAVTTWLHRIVVNACLDRARRAATRRTRPLDDQPGHEDLLGHDEGADISAERGELRRELGTALASLPAEQRAALVLVDMQGYPVAEAALMLGVPTGTVKSRCARGRARLLPQIAHLRASAVSRETSSTTPEAAPAGGVSRETLPREDSAAPLRAPDPAADPPRERDTAPPPRGRNPEAGTSVPLLATPRIDAPTGGGEQPT
ncbi:RNA polymerase sigma factor SigM [Streptacidiphilus sp. MAP12-16]|uniref:RNA polymerase sigma factor SigM n=1 Tax=Streptacidiphilus sp. MAP12-16 TaxID=3156300 RepID=UPI0035136141